VKAKINLIALIIMIVLYIFTFLILPGDDSFSICPSKSIFGIRCPLCGMGRSFANISHLKLDTAFETNKSAFLFYPLYVLSMYMLFINFLYKNYNLKFPVYKLIPFITKRSIYIVLILFCIALIFYLYDIINGAGEKFFDPDRIFINKIKSFLIR